MKSKFITCLSILTCSILLFSCKKNQVEESTNEQVSQEVVDQIKFLGFNTYGIKKLKDGYLVENDIFLSDKELQEAGANVKMRVAETEQYSTNNLIAINGSRVITVSIVGFPQAYIDAADEAIARYNSLNLRLSFQRVTSGGKSIL